MEYFHSIKDSDIFENPEAEPENYTDRLTVKGLVFNNENKIALLWHPTEHYGLFPGGGIELDETEEEAFIRECKEKIGCDVVIESKIGTGVQYRAKDGRKFTIHFFVARVVGEIGKPTTTQEDELSIQTKWLTESELREQLNDQTLFKHPEWYQRQFNSHSHYAALQKYRADKK
jgi:ADP-ribose pyrophosphatase YjhB (NUDIX family)